MSKSINFSAMGIIEPSERIKNLASFGNTVEIDTNVPATRYPLVISCNVFFNRNFFKLPGIIDLGMK